MARSAASDIPAILEVLRLEPAQVQEDSGTIVAVIHNDWLPYLSKYGIVPSAKELNVPQSSWESLPPRPAHERVDSPWRRVQIDVVPKPKTGKILVPRIHTKWLMKGDLGYVEFMQCLAKQNYLSQWEQAYQTHAALLMANKNAGSDKQESCVELLEILRTLFHCPVFKIDLTDQPREQEQLMSTRNHPFHTPQQQQQQHPNMLSILCILETPQALYMVRPRVRHTLQDCVTFSPAMLGNSNAKPLFVIYQILKVFDHCHQQGIPCGDVTLRDFAMDKNLWVTFRGPKWKDVMMESWETRHPEMALERPNNENSVASAKTDPLPSLPPPQPPTLNQYTLEALPELVLRWVKGELTNFDYLMILNTLAGRHMCNPNHHPVLPWVMDFTRPDAGFRDLSRSKYRLTKGDHQLDFMYESSMNLSTSPTDTALQIPHHITDVLSEITYYVYTARRTPKSVLCAHVRSTWVPNEYPSSLQRLQEWSPDECIPEFFTDPGIFKSIHDDLPDLEIPSWCSGPDDFIAKHRAILESDYVSERLHRWIDLTFGYKLSGGAAIRAKNVCLHLVDQHTHPTNHGAVQLFNFPHPRRLTSSPYLSPTPPSIVRRQPRVEKMELAQADGAVFTASQLRRMSDVSVAVSATEGVPETGSVTGQADTLGLGTVTDGASISSAMEVSTDVNLEVSLSTMETINLISGTVASGGNGGMANKPPPPEVLPQAQVVQASVAQTGDETSLLKNPIKKLPFFRSKADALMEARPSIQRPEQMTIGLPEDYDPLAALTQLESLYSFSSRALQGLPADRSERFPANQSIRLLGHDMHVMGCLIVELFLAPKLRMQQPHTSLLERCQVLRRLLSTEWLDLPRAVRQLTRLLLEMDTKPNPEDLVDCLYKRPAMGYPFPTASVLLQPIGEVISFPGYMSHLYEMLSEFPVGAVGPSGSSSTKVDQRKQSIAKIQHFSRHLPKIMHHLTAEGRDLLFPYLLELFASPNTALYGCLLLLSKVAQFIGSKQALRKLLLCLTQLYDAEFTSPNFMLLFHKSFLAQLMVWLGLSQFLDHVIAYLVDAVTGLKECPEFGTTVDDPISMIAEDKKIRPVSINEDGLDLISLGDEVDLPRGDSVDLPMGQPEGEVSDNSSSEEEVPDVYQSSRKNSESTDTSSLEQTAQAEDAQDENMDGEIKTAKLPKDENRSSPVKVSQETSEGEAVGREQAQPSGDSNRDLDAKLDSPSPRLVTDEPASRDPAEADPKVGTDTDPPLEAEEDPMHEYLMASLTKGRMTSLGSLAPGSRLVDVASESITWLVRRLGPSLTATYLTKRLLKALKTCYMGAQLLSYYEVDSDSDSSDDEYGVYIEQRSVMGDSNAKSVLGCLTDVALLYGDQFILKQYFTYIKEMVCSVRHKVNLKAEAGLVASMALLRNLLAFLTDTQLMDHLTFIFRNILQPLVNVVQSCQLGFPSGGQARAVICYKLVDVMTSIGLRIGREMAREHMTGTLQHFFVCFELVHGDGWRGTKFTPDIERQQSHPFSRSSDSEDMYCEIKVDSQTNQYKIGTPTKLENLRGEMTRSPPTISAQLSDNLDTLEDRHSVDPEIMKELKETFSAEMANTAYVPLCRLIGSIHMERILYNHDLIWKLSSQHERALSKQRAAFCASVGDDLTGEAEQRQTSWFVDIGALDNKDDPLHVLSTKNAHVVGNRIDIAQYSSDSDSGPEEEKAASNNPIRSASFRPKSKRQNPSLKMGKSKRQLKGGWLSYWESYCENSPDAFLAFNQIKLQTFVGHSGSIKALYAMDNENSFMSASKDKTVKLWSLRNQGDGSGQSSCRFTYRHHRKTVFAVTFLQAQRLVASCDGSVHLWDPFTGALVHRYDLSKFVPNVLVRMPAPSPMLVVATAESNVRLIDTRTSVVQQELKVASGALGLIRCLAISPDSSTLGVGLSSGVMSMVDLSSGLLLGGWRAHDGEVLQIKACSGNRFLTSSVDHTMALWREDGTRVCTFRGASEPVHCMCITKGQIVSATTSNKIGLHTSLDPQASYSSCRIRSDLAKGMLTTMDVMPLNRLFLLGSDNGTVSLLA